jgi:serine/threonine-protein kinase HipA
MVFNLLVSNVDDHMRNHGFLRGGEGWRLSPAFDMNPCPVDVKGRIHVMAFNEDDHSSSLDTCISMADYFALKKGEAQAIAAEVAAVTATWADIAKQCKLSKFDIERMESAFDHDDLKEALADRTATPVKAPAKMRAPAAAKKAKTPVAAKRRKSTR